MSIIPTLTRPTINPNVGGEIWFSGSLAVGAGEVVYGVGEFIRLYWSNRQRGRHGEYRRHCMGRHDRKRLCGHRRMYMQDIVVTGVVAAEARRTIPNSARAMPGGSASGAVGRRSPIRGRSTPRTDVGLAIAVEHWGPDVVIENSGVIAARREPRSSTTAAPCAGAGAGGTSTALTCTMRRAGRSSPKASTRRPSSTAAGTFDSTGAAPEILNDGVIKAVSLDPGFESVGILAAHLEIEEMQIINNGLIEADVAIRGGSSTWPYTPADEWIFNSATGTIRGDIETVLGDDRLINRGLLEGNVFLGIGDDEFDSAGATFIGYADFALGQRPVRRRHQGRPSHRRADGRRPLRERRQRPAAWRPRRRPDRGRHRQRRALRRVRQRYPGAARRRPGVRRRAATICSSCRTSRSPASTAARASIHPAAGVGRVGIDLLAILGSSRVARHRAGRAGGRAAMARRCASAMTPAFNGLRIFGTDSSSLVLAGALDRQRHCAIRAAWLFTPIRPVGRPCSSSRRVHA